MRQRAAASLCVAGALLGASVTMLGTRRSPPDAAVNRLTAREIRLIDEQGRDVLTMRVDGGRAVVELHEPDGTSRRLVSEPIADQSVDAASPDAPRDGGEEAGSPGAVAPPAGPGIPTEAWVRAEAWDSIVLHSSKDAVAKLLGPPRDVRKTSSGETWLYGPGVNGEGRVYFDSGNRVTGWYEPRRTSEGG